MKDLEVYEKSITKTMVSKSVNRRTAIKAIGGTIVGSVVSSGGTIAEDPNDIISEIQQNGYYWGTPQGLANFGFESNFRSFHRPLRLQSDHGGIVSHRLDGGRIMLKVDLTDKDKLGAIGVASGIIEIGEISQIKLVSVGDNVGIGLQLGLRFNGETFYNWEEISGHKEKWVAFDGDDLATISGQFSGHSTVDSDDESFDIAGIGDAEQVSGVSIDSMADDFGADTPVRITISLQGGDAVNQPPSSQARLRALNVVRN